MISAQDPDLNSSSQEAAGADIATEFSFAAEQYQTV